MENAIVSSNVSNSNYWGNGCGSWSITYGTASTLHCCTCQSQNGIACYHTGGPTFCNQHTNWNSNHTVIWPATATPTIVLDYKCYICKEDIDIMDLPENDKVCKDCRKTIESFKAILVEEKK